MKVININYRNTFKQYILRCLVLLFVVNFTASAPVFCQTTDSISVSAAADSSSVATTTADDSGDPSLNNLSKNIPVIEEERKKDKLRQEEEARWNTIISYIQMIVGFAITITLAWFLASWARKKELIKAEEKRIRVEKALIKKGFTVVEDSEKKAGDTTLGLKPPPGHRTPKRRR